MPDFNCKTADGFMDGLISLGVPAAELIVCRDRKILYHGIRGFSDTGRRVPANASDRYWLYSCTKPITACAAMRAVEDGLIALDDEVEKYIPAFGGAFLLKDGEKIKPSSKITLRRLLTMSAGLDYNTHRGSVDSLLRETDFTATTVQVAEAFIKSPLSFEPGEQYQYSLCLDVLGAVIEAASHMSFRDYVQKYILRPLDMEDTDFVTEGVPERLSSQYIYNGAAKSIDYIGSSNPFLLSSGFYSGGAGLVSTASDYIKFADALACGGTGANGIKILTPKSIDIMSSDHINELRHPETFSCPAGPDYSYGLGVRTRVRSEHGKKSCCHEFGWDGAAGADLLIDPEHRLSFILLQHVLGWPDFEGNIHEKLRDAVYGAAGLV